MNSSMSVAQDNVSLGLFCPMHDQEPDRSCFVIHVYYYIPVNSLSRKDKLKIRCNAHWKFSRSSVLVLRFHDMWSLIVQKRHVLSCGQTFPCRLPRTKREPSRPRLPYVSVSDQRLRDFVTLYVTLHFCYVVDKSQLKTNKILNL